MIQALIGPIANLAGTWFQNKLEKTKAEGKAKVAEARKSRRYAEKMAQRRKEELLEMMGYSIAFIALLAFGGMILYFVGKWTGKL